ncbi:MAG: DUF4416 family protein [Candidatus Marinimicrobia bacterium]|nr:DUF4416 family protein [Candidatus Neomarinimicrobiota bacterium]
MKAEAPQPVKYFIGVLFSNRDILKQAETSCRSEIGEVDARSEAFPFTTTRYYDGEMGRPIFRRFISFETLMSPGELARLKVLCNRIEEGLRVEGSRKVNLDVGYLDFHKMILASAKYNGQKIYLDQGIYADLTLIFENGKFQSVDNTFPDFRSGQYDEVFLGFRNTYKAQLKVMQ